MTRYWDLDSLWDKGVPCDDQPVGIQETESSEKSEQHCSSKPVSCEDRQRLEPVLDVIASPRHPKSRLKSVETFNWYIISKINLNPTNHRTICLGGWCIFSVWIFWHVMMGGGWLSLRRGLSRPPEHHHQPQQGQQQSQQVEVPVQLQGVPRLRA